MAAVPAVLVAGLLGLMLMPAAAAAAGAEASERRGRREIKKACSRALAAAANRNESGSGSVGDGKVCEACLAPYAAVIGTSRDAELRVLGASLKVALNACRRLYASVRGLSHAKSNGKSKYKRRLKDAAGDCVEQLGDAREQARQSYALLRRVGTGARARAEVASHRDDVRTFLSAAMTEQSSCVDGFVELGLRSSPVFATLSTRVRSAQRILSVALALITNFPFSGSGSGSGSATTTEPPLPSQM